MNQHAHSSAAKQVRRAGPAQPCDHCSEPTKPPDVMRQGATTTRYLHPVCGERDGVGSIVDANDARRLQGESGRRGELRVIA